jgi:hypothetical protein
MFAEKYSYRLNVFGFPGARGARKNAGFQDARMVFVFSENSGIA